MTQVFGLCKWEDRVIVSWMGKTLGEAGLGTGWKGLGFLSEHAEFEISVGQPGGHVERSVGRKSLEF